MLPDRYIALLQAEADAKQSEDVISATVAEPNAETKPAAETKAPGGAKSAAK
jgi:hypothetical protein